MIKDKKIKYFFPSSTRNLENEDVLCFVKRRRDGEMNKTAGERKKSVSRPFTTRRTRSNEGREGGANQRNSRRKDGRKSKDGLIHPRTQWDMRIEAKLTYLGGGEGGEKVRWRG